MGSRSFLYGTHANWVELFQLAKAFDMGIPLLYSSFYAIMIVEFVGTSTVNIHMFIILLEFVHHLCFNPGFNMFPLVLLR